MKKKVIVIGLDGGTLDYVLPWINELPAFKYLLDNGCWGTLKSVIPPHTAPAWPSYLTGRNPANHGIFSFFYKNVNNEIEFIDSGHIAEPTILDLISNYAKKVISINVPVTYPPWNINGIMISGMLTPPNTKFCTPEKIANEIPYYKVEPDVSFNEKNIEHFLDVVYDTLYRREKATFYLMSKYEWDFLTVVFRASDIISHTFRKFLNPDEPLHKKYGNEILNLYKKIDKILDRFIKQMDKNTILIIMSDHGHGEFKKMINLNIWLSHNGYLKFKSDLLHKIKFLAVKSGFTQGKVYNILSKLELQNIVMKFSREKRYKGQTLFLSFKDIDWDRTSAYALGPFGQIYINKYKTTNQKSEYEHLRDELIMKLKEIKDPEDGTQIFEKVLKKEEVYSGKFLENAPDLYLIPHKYEYASYELLASSFKLFEQAPKGWTGTHKLHGIFIAFGDGVKRNYKVKDANIIDLAPTVLSILNLPVPDDIDGQVIKSIFEKEIKIQVVRSEKIKVRHEEKKDIVKDDKKIEKRLKSLGYL